MLRVIDRHLWAVPVAVFVLTCIGDALSGRFIGVTLSFTSGPLRQQFYTSLTGSSSALLGFLIAAITILSTFTKVRPNGVEQQRGENLLARARNGLVLVLLVAALLMLIALVASSLALASSNDAGRLPVLDGLIVAASAGGVVGLVIGGLGLGLVVAERARL